MGAVGITLWAQLASNMFDNEYIWVENDHIQASLFATEAILGVAFAGYLFKYYPYYFFPSVLARAFDYAEQAEEGTVRISIGPSAKTPRAKGPDDKGTWT